MNTDYRNTLTVGTLGWAMSRIATIRAGELGIDDAVTRARDDQQALDGLLRKRGGG